MWGQVVARPHLCRPGIEKETFFLLHSSLTSEMFFKKKKNCIYLAVLGLSYSIWNLVPCMRVCSVMSNSL